MTTEEDYESVPRKPGCMCHIEEGDSPCPVHGEDVDSTEIRDKLARADLEKAQARIRELEAELVDRDGVPWRVCAEAATETT